jgi:peptidoglycan/xylan/chitin deacetylase (PgdA/CDA1 family)
MPTILLSYDVEEFDMPFEYGGNLSMEEQLAFSTNGLNKLLKILDKHNIKATFYCTAVYALAKKEVIQKLHAAGHEIASHTYYHSKFVVDDLANSKKVLEKIINNKVYGLRMPRMMPVLAKDVLAAGYEYNSSINPTWLPGRYNNLKASRVLYNEDGLKQLPASVTPLFRIPLFWLSFHNFPFWLYWQCCKRAIKKDDYINLYFHPWEFEDYSKAGNAKFPDYVTKNCGEEMERRTEQLILKCKDKGFEFNTTIDWLKAKQDLIQ